MDWVFRCNTGVWCSLLINHRKYFLSTIISTQKEEYIMKMVIKTSVSSLSNQVRISEKETLLLSFSNVPSGHWAPQAECHLVLLYSREDWHLNSRYLNNSATYIPTSILMDFTHLLHICRCAGRPGQDAESHPQSDPQASHWWWSASRCPCRQSQTGPWEAKTMVTVLNKITSSPSCPTILIMVVIIQQSEHYILACSH